MILCVLQDQFCFSFLFSQGAGKIVVFVQSPKKPLESSECCCAENIVIYKRWALQKKITALDYNGH